MVFLCSRAHSIMGLIVAALFDGHDCFQLFYYSFAFFRSLLFLSKTGEKLTIMIKQRRDRQQPTSWGSARLRSILLVAHTVNRQGIKGLHQPSISSDDKTDPRAENYGRKINENIKIEMLDYDGTVRSNDNDGEYHKDDFRCRQLPPDWYGSNKLFMRH